jgi:hypothetical protein
MRRLTQLSCLITLLLGASAFAGDAVCQNDPSGVPVQRRLRQLYLDLLGRPPTLEEYRFIEAKGAVLDDDIQALLQKEEFYGKVKTYHRALLRANISANIYTEGESRLSTSTDGLQPGEFRSFVTAGLRGVQGVGCDHFVRQDDCNATRQDPQLEPATKTCRDAMGVPLPVSVDYDTNKYTCTPLTGATSCADAVTKALLPAKNIYFCDMRRTTTGLVPHACHPDTGKPQTAALTQEVLDGDGNVIAYANPTAGASPRLDHCTLNLGLSGGVHGRYVPQNGCIQREGVVTVTQAYWSGGQPVNVCAIEAQANATNPWTMETCETSRFWGDRTCGCGVGLRRCETGTAIHQARIDGLSEEPLRIVDSVVRREEDYFNVLTTRRSFVNGPLSQLYRNAQSPGVWLTTTPSVTGVPDVPIEQADTWAEYTRDEQHAGVLTTAAWLYRFPTQRARVNQFYQAFLCKQFTPPADAVVPAPDDSCNRQNNLAIRCGCKYCHATIEPTGAHWGRFGQRNAQYLDPTRYPRFDARCRDCALAGNTSCDGDCGNYVMQALDGDSSSDLGLLSTYLYRTSAEEPNVAGGPALLVERMMQTGDLERCAVLNLWHELLGRSMTSEEQTMYLESLVADFAAHGHNLKSLVLSIVKTDAYRRVD